jgi:hypothetical protein
MSTFLRPTIKNLLYKDKRQFIKENLRILNAEKKWPCFVVKPER